MKENMKKISIRDFSFAPTGYGRYKVAYTSPITGKIWKTTVTDMTVIDATKNADEPKKKDLENLKWRCKNL